MKNKPLLIGRLIYLVNILYNAYLFIKTKNTAYVTTILWIINAAIMFSLCIKSNEMQEKRIKQKDKLIEKLLEERIKKNESI